MTYIQTTHPTRSFRNTHMNKSTILTAISLAIFSITACDSKEESARKNALESKADALENKADTVKKETKEVAKDFAKQAEYDAIAQKDAEKLRAENAKKAAADTAEELRRSGERAAKALEGKAKDTREQK